MGNPRCFWWVPLWMLQILTFRDVTNKESENQPNKGISQEGYFVFGM